MLSPSAHPQLPLLFQTQSLLLVSEVQTKKTLSLPFLLCLPGLPELPFLPGKQQATLSIANMHHHKEFFLPSLDQVGAALFPASAFGKQLWRNPSFPPLVTPTRLGMSLTPSFLSCAVEMQKEKIQVADMSGKLRVSLPQDTTDVKGCHEFEGDGEVHGGQNY